MSNSHAKTLLCDLLDRVNDESPIWKVAPDVKEILQKAAQIKVVIHADTDEIRTEELRHTYFLRLKRSKAKELKGFIESCENLERTSAKQLKLIITQTDRLVLTIWYSDSETVCCFYRYDSKL